MSFTMIYVVSEEIKSIFPCPHSKTIMQDSRSNCIHYNESI